MNPQDPSQPQQPAQAQQPASGVPPITPASWQQTTPTTQATPAYQPPADQAQFTHAPGVADSNYSIDYLNQIAPTQQKAVNRFAVIALIAGVIISALFAVILMTSSGGPSANDQLAPLSLRIETLKTVTGDQQKHLTENQINEANAALNSSLTTMSTDLTALMDARKIKIKEKSTQRTTEATYSADLAKTLDDSYQRGTLDRTYTSQMTYELTVLKSKLNKLKRSTKSTEISDFATSSISDIDTVLKVYAAFDAAKS